MMSRAEFNCIIFQLLHDYPQVVLVRFDYCGHELITSLRNSLEVSTVVCLGKNSFTKRAIRDYVDITGSKTLLNLIPLIAGKVGWIFTKGDLKEVVEELAKFKFEAPAHVGLVAPVDVVLPPGNTGLDTSKASIFQVLDIPTKINCGYVEIVAPVKLVKKGDIVGAYQAYLIKELRIRPFSYGLMILSVYDNGFVYSPEVFYVTEDDLIAKFAAGVSMATSVALAVSYPTLSAAPHMFTNGYKNVLAVSIATDYTFPRAKKVKEYLQGSSSDTEYEEDVAFAQFECAYEFTCSNRSISEESPPINFELPEILRNESQDWDRLLICKKEERTLLMKALKRFVRLVKKSGGYDVDVYPPSSILSTPFTPLYGFQFSLRKYEWARMATDFAIKHINKVECRQIPYVLVDVKKVVLTPLSHVLLTFSVKEAESDDPVDAPDERTFAEPPLSQISEFVKNFDDDDDSISRFDLGREPGYCDSEDDCTYQAAVFAPGTFDVLVFSPNKEIVGLSSKFAVVDLRKKLVCH